MSSNCISNVLNMPIQVEFNNNKNKNIFRYRIEGKDSDTPKFNKPCVLKISSLSDYPVKVISVQHLNESCYLFVVEITTGFIFKTKDQMNVILYIEGLTNNQEQSQEQLQEQLQNNENIKLKIAANSTIKLCVNMKDKVCNIKI
jgi:hypothetical protein